MNTKDYKDIFKSFPQRAWLSSTLQKVIKGGDYDSIIDYLNGTKDINQVDSIEELYTIKTTFFKLYADCKLITENIEKLKLHFLGEFDDKKMDISEIGISKTDEFECIQDFQHWNMITILKGSKIRVIDFQYAGANSHIDCRFIDHLTDDTTRKHFPNSDEIKLLFTFSDLKQYFNRI